MPSADILIAESRGFSPRALDILSRCGRVRLADAGAAELRALAAGADVLWVRLRNRIDASVMDAAPRLKLIATPTTGLNHIDTLEAAARGIRVLSLRGAGRFLADVRATAEHAMALMLALLRNVPAAARHVQEGGWNRDLFRGAELYGKTVGVVGYGRLGRIVARYLAAFDASVLAADPYVNQAAVDPWVRLVTLPELLRASDIVTVHAALSAETVHLIGASQFASMPEGSRFVNTARGEVVDEAALIDALRSGRLAGAAVDVVWGEHATGAPSSALIDYARVNGNLIVTPHIGGCTGESMEKTEVYMASQVGAALAGFDGEAGAMTSANST